MSQKKLTEIITKAFKLFDSSIRLNFKLLRRVVITDYDQQLFNLNVDQSIVVEFYRWWAEVLNTSVSMLKIFYLRMINNK